MGVPEGEKGAESLFEEIMSRTFPNFRKEMDIIIQYVQITPTKIYPQRPTLGHIVLTLDKILMLSQKLLQHTK